MSINISNQIRMLQAARGLNDSQTANILGIKKQNYSRKFKNQTFSVSDLQKISDALGFDINIVFTDRENGNNIKSIYQPQVQINTISIPCSENKVSAGLGDDLYDYEQWDTKLVVETPQSRKADFILIVDGDSMYPDFNDGDYVLVRQQPAVDIGQIGIFKVENKGYIKKYNGDCLVSINSDYDDIPIVNKDFKCFGLVLGIADIYNEH